MRLTHSGRRPVPPPSVPGRRAFTLVELLVVMVLLGIVVGGLVQVLAGQQRFYRSAAELMDSRSQIRQAAGILPADLRGLSINGLDVLAASDTSIDMRITIASGIVCAATANTVSLPPAVLASGQTLTSFRWTPAVGDIVMIYNGGPTGKANDDTWTQYTLADFQSVVGACPTGVPSVAASYISAADALRPSFRLTLNPNLDGNHELGAPVRILRRVNYALYQASDRNWYLGFRSCPNNACSVIQPVSGPYKGFDGPNAANNGLQLTYYDTLGVELDPGNAANLDDIGRVRITVRGETESAVAIPGFAPAPKSDTMQVFVGIRNRT